MIRSCYRQLSPRMAAEGSIQQHKPRWPAKGDMTGEVRLRREITAANVGTGEVATGRILRRLVCLAGCDWSRSSRFLSILVPVDLQFFRAVENDVVAGPSEIPPRPFHEGLDFGAG